MHYEYCSTGNNSQSQLPHLIDNKLTLTYNFKARLVYIFVRKRSRVIIIVLANGWLSGLELHHIDLAFIASHRHAVDDIAILISQRWLHQ